MKIIITCINNGIPWTGTFYDKSRVANFLKRLRAKSGITNIEIKEEGAEKCES